MAFRFQKRIKLFTGTRLNLSKSGVSTSLGRTGAQITVGRQTRATVGIPGSGLSYTTSGTSGGGRGTASGACRPAGGARRAPVYVAAFLFGMLACWLWNIMTKFDISMLASVVLSSVLAYLVHKVQPKATPPEDSHPPDA